MPAALAIHMQPVHTFVIKGLTGEGRLFRPSDWAQRLTTAVSTSGPDRRVRFHPRVTMATLQGVNCVVIDAALEQEDQMLFEFLINFGRNNQLQIEEHYVPLAGSGQPQEA